MSATLLVLALLASWRLGRLAAIDEIARPIRNRIVARNPEGQVAYLVTCVWCVSMWTSVPLSIAAVYLPGYREVWVVLIVLAGSLVAGFGQSLEDRLDR
tara:strand:+ start:873 stop:1169 length:297 start_codon:yes stop_codon:yes gene_type:complete